MLIGIYKIWIRDDQDPAMAVVDDTEIVPNNTKAQRRNGGVDLIVNRVVRYKTPDELSPQTMQVTAVKLGAITMIVMYTSPIGDHHEEPKVFSRINQVSGAKAIIMSDLNARCALWEKRNYTRDIRLKNGPENMDVNSDHRTVCPL